MSSSSERMCIVTRQKHPSSFLINLRPTHFPSTPTSSSSLQLLPDRVASPLSRKKGKGMWVSCHRDVIQQLPADKGPHTGLLRQIPSLQVPANLVEIIHAQLVSRVIYELEHFAKSIGPATPRSKWLSREASTSSSEVRTAGQSGSSGSILVEKEADGGIKVGSAWTVVRRLMEEEVEVSKDDGESMVIKPQSHESGANIIAILDISNLALEKPDSSSETVEMKSDHTIPSIPLVSITSPSPTTTAHQIPLYTLATLLPASSHERIRKAITSILATERNHARRLRSLSRSPCNDDGETTPSTVITTPTSKAASLSTTTERVHTNLLALSSFPCSTITSTDDPDYGVGALPYFSRGELGVPLAIALWRLRCFHGQGWEAV
ncbi:hypothetical protein CI109_103807 [Kwoniella shandongensis]|uniref:Uncharacterized protein n=1 Tax=Kwoniella shandongensis TaxID=1734106 RepID=A0A5M6C737_9TREE|nr:uncharacterized protein CI109_000499 [Kwoniella shandongensis]KAA5530928.1 hypothetical protein CI109_000499 [Kwoniella shandongensis]